MIARAEALLRAAGISGAIRSCVPVAPIVSPMCRAADWTCLRVTTDAGAIFLKLPEDGAAGFVTPHAAAAGARMAAAVGVAPALRFVDAESGAMGFELLAPPWREARLGDLGTPDVLAAVIAARRALHGAGTLPRTWDVFAEIDRLAKELPTAPDDLPVLLQAIARIRAAFDAAGHDSVPCHADGTVSNIMLHPDGLVRLVDFDCAGMADPHYDLGILLNEACTLPAEWSAGMELAFGRDARHDLARCQAYAVADDLLWGLWGLSQHARSPRTGLEFLKYGRWRLLRCRMGLRRPDHLRHL